MISRHKKAIYFVACLCAAFYALDRSVTFVLQSIIKGSEFRVVKLYNDTIDCDVLVMGNSRGANGFYAPSVSQKLGKKVFNLSFNGFDPAICNVLLQDYCSRNRPPSMVVLEVTCAQSRDSVDGVRFLMEYSDGINDLIRQGGLRQWVLCKVCSVYQFNTEVFLRTLYYHGKSDQTWINEGLVNEEIAKNWKTTEKETLLWDTPMTESMKGVRDLLSYCKTKGIAVKLVMTPYYPGYTDRFESFASWKESVQSAIGKDIEIHDYSQAIQESSCFADMVHLNKVGSEHFLEVLEKDHFFAQ